MSLPAYAQCSWLPSVQPSFPPVSSQRVKAYKSNKKSWRLAIAIIGTLDHNAVVPQSPGWLSKVKASIAEWSQTTVRVSGSLCFESRMAGFPKISAELIELPSKNMTWGIATSGTTSMQWCFKSLVGSSKVKTSSAEWSQTTVRVYGSLCFKSRVAGFPPISALS